MDPRGAEVVRLLENLRKKLDAAVVVDDELRRRIISAHEEGGMEHDAHVVVVMRPPPPPERLKALRELHRELFNAELPADITAFFVRHDGMWVADVDDDSIRAELIADEHYEAGIFSVGRIHELLTSVTHSVTHASGEVLHHHPPVVPFFDVPDQGWHALDHARRTPDGAVPVVAYYFDEADGSSATECEVIAPSFSDWLAGWIESGMVPFWFRRE